MTIKIKRVKNKFKQNKMIKRDEFQKESRRQFEINCTMGM